MGTLTATHDLEGCSCREAFAKSTAFVSLTLKTQLQPSELPKNNTNVIVLPTIAKRLCFSITCVRVRSERKKWHVRENAGFMCDGAKHERQSNTYATRGTRPVQISNSIHKNYYLFSSWYTMRSARVYDCASKAHQTVAAKQTEAVHTQNKHTKFFRKLLLENTSFSYDYSWPILRREYSQAQLHGSWLSSLKMIKCRITVSGSPVWTPPSIRMQDRLVLPTKQWIVL